MSVGTHWVTCYTVPPLVLAVVAVFLKPTRQKPLGKMYGLGFRRITAVLSIPQHTRLQSASSLRNTS